MNRCTYLLSRMDKYLIAYLKCNIYQINKCKWLVKERFYTVDLKIGKLEIQSTKYMGNSEGMTSTR